MNIGLAFTFLLLTSGWAFSQAPEATTPASASNNGNAVSAASNPKPSILPDLDRLETAASQTSLDIGRLRIEKWKGSSIAKSAAQADADSVQRNLKSALPGLIGALRSAPEDLNAEFKLYRNVNALCDVLSSLTEVTRAVGPNSDYEELSTQLRVLISVRHDLGESLEERTAATQHELNQARIQLKTQQEQMDAAAKAPPKEVVVAQTEPPKKPAPKKKVAAKKPVSAAGGSNPNSPAPNPSGQTKAGTQPPKS